MTTLTRARSLPMWRSLAVRDFRLLWASEAISLVGDQFHLVALAWLVISFTQSGLALGTVLIAVGVPRALLLIPFGVIADRRPSRTLMLGANIARGFIVGAIAALVLSGQATLPLLALLGALFGAADAAYLPAQQAFLPRTLDADRLPSANAILQGTMQVASIVGPPIAGAAIVALGTGPAFVVDSLSFFAAALVVMLISTPRVPSAVAGRAEAEARTDEASAPVAPATVASAMAEPEAESFVTAVRDGIEYVMRDRALRLTLLISLVCNFAFNGPAAVGIPWLSEVRYHAGPVGLGILTAAWAVGALVGVVIAGNVKLERQGTRLLASVLVAGIAMLGVGLAPGVPAALVALAVMGVMIGFVNIVALSWLQARVEPAMIGRVMSLAMLMGFGITPLSLAVAGILLDVNATVLFVGAAGLVVVTAIGAWLAGYPAVFDEPRATGEVYRPIG